MLAEHMLRKASASLGTPVATLDAKSLARLTQHTWPGNVRELEHTLRRAVVLAGGAVIHVEHLSIASPRSAASITVAPLDEVERQQVARALSVTNGNKVRSAELLGITRPRLRRLIATYGLDVPGE